MKLNVDTIFNYLDGAPIVQKNEKGEDENITFKSAAISALLAPRHDDDGVIKFKMFNLANKINAGGEIDFTVDELVLAKDRIGRTYAPLIVGNAFNLIDSPASE